jgi:hypothetical protein
VRFAVGCRLAPRGGLLLGLYCREDLYKYTEWLKFQRHRRPLKRSVELDEACDYRVIDRVFEGY